MDVIAHTITIILISLVMEDRAAAADLIIHIWYSAHLRPSHVKLITKLVRPIIARAYELALAASSDTGEDHPHEHRLVEHGRGLVIKLMVEDWRRLLAYFTFAPEDEGVDPASCLDRKAVTFNDAYTDERDLLLLRNSPHQRVAMIKFWQNGILQPFGQDSRDFTIPNP